MTPAAILAALLSLYPRSPAAQCLHARRGAILDALDAAHRAHPEVSPAPGTDDAARVTTTEAA